MLFFGMTKLGTMHNRPKFDICRKAFFGDLAMSKSNFSLHLSKDLNFRHTSKKIKVGSPKDFGEKNVFPKKYVELRTFDGIKNRATGISIPASIIYQSGKLCHKNKR
jgi:hypothetical protein